MANFKTEFDQVLFFLNGNGNGNGNGYGNGNGDGEGY